MVIKNMFSSKEPEPQVNKKGRGRKGDHNDDGAQIPARDDNVGNTTSFGLMRGVNELGEHRSSQLPELDVPKMTFCYVCIGPRQRGKFDIQKAENLRIPRGPVRARLTRGETVMFMEDDVNGGQVERTVRPEDVMGLPEAPKASSLFIFEYS
ncbi:uncharacterized protein PHACADRAFT_254321, partial [Phanerochaete carnosa HHB-10118-sp]